MRFTVSGTMNSELAQITETDDGVLPTTFEFYVGESLHINSDVVVPSRHLGYMRTTGSLSNGQSLTLPFHNVKNHNVLTFCGRITSFESLKIGKQTDTYILIDSTNITIHNDQGSRIEAHGLSIANDIQVIIANETDVNASLIRITSSGNIYEVTQSPYKPRFLMDEGSPYVISNNSILTDCVFSWTSRNINKPIWLFGDSYFSWYQSRWTYYLAEDGYTDSCMLNGYAGEGSVDAITALRNLLNVRVPQTVVWCIGMNNEDTSSQLNPTWYNCYTELIGLSKHYGFEVILATIPNTPTIINSFKNAVVKNSGYRYINFADAVNIDDSGNWISGTLSADNVHPTEQGARVLYNRVLADLPEITLN